MSFEMNGMGVCLQQTVLVQLETVIIFHCNMWEDRAEKRWKSEMERIIQEGSPEIDTGGAVGGWRA